MRDDHFYDRYPSRPLPWFAWLVPGVIALWPVIETVRALGRTD